MNADKNAFDTILTSPEPVKAILDMATTAIQNNNLDVLHDVDVMLMDRFIEFVRNGTHDDLNSFLHKILSFIDSSEAGELKKLDEGQMYFHRWEHFHGMCNMAIENYDPRTVERFVMSRKHGAELLRILGEQEDDGVRSKELAGRLGVEPSYLARLLKEFEAIGLVTRDKHNSKLTMVKLDYLGRTYLAENKAGYPLDNHPTAEEKASAMHDSSSGYGEKPAGKESINRLASYYGNPKEWLFPN